MNVDLLISSHFGLERIHFGLDRYLLVAECLNS